MPDGNVAPARRPWRLTIAMAMAVAALGCRDTRPFHGAVVQNPGVAPPLRLTDQHGASFALADQRGHPTLVFFGYTHCPDVCPTTLADWVRVKAALGDKARDVRFVFVTIDPARDSAAAVTAFLAQFDSSFTGLTGSADQIEAVKRDWGITAIPESDSTHGMTMGHSAQTFVVGPDGKTRLFFLPGMKPADMADDVKRLL